MSLMSNCTVCMVIFNPQLMIESQDYGATPVTKRGISMHDTSLCCKDSPSKDVLCHTWNYFHAWHVTLLQGQPIKIWIFRGKASSAQGLNTKPNEHIESKVIWDPPYYFLLQVWKRCLVFLLISDHRFYQQATGILTIGLHHYVTFCILEKRTSPSWIVWDLPVKSLSSPQFQGWIGVWKGLHVPNIKLSRYWTYSREAFCVWYWTSKVITHRCKRSFLNIPSKLRKAQKYPVEIVKIMRLWNYYSQMQIFLPQFPLDILKSKMMITIMLIMEKVKMMTILFPQLFFQILGRI